MADVIAEFIAQLSFKADLRDLTEAEKKAKEAAEKSAQAWQKFGGVISSVGKLALGAGGGLLALVERSVASAAAIDDMAQRAHLGTRELQRLQFAATKAGAGPEALADAFKTLDRQISEARKGTGPAAEAFRSLGLSATNLVDLNAEQRLQVLADKLQGLSDPALKTKIALDLLGGSGDKLLPALNDGAAGLKAAGDEAERLGLVLRDDAIKQAAALDDQLEATKLQALAMARGVGVELIPVVQNAIRNWQDWAKVIGVFGVALGGLKIGGVATQLTQLGFAAAGAKLGVAGLVVTVGALSYSLASALDNALGLSDALAGVNQSTVQRGSTALGDLSNADRDALSAAVQRRNAAQANVDGSDMASQAHRFQKDVDSAQAEIDTIQARGRANARGIAGLRKATAGATTPVERANAERSFAEAAKATDKANANASKLYAEEEARKKKKEARKKKKGPKKKDEVDPAILAKFNADHGEELRGLASRFGVGSAAVDAAIKAGAESVEDGSTTYVARNAALSRLGGAAGVDLTIKKQTDPLLSQIFGDENVPDVQLSQIARGAEPQVLISNITNNFEFDIDQHIDGSGDPAMVADLSGRSVREYFQGSIKAATNTSKVNFAR